jgi:hypothetical protein
MPFGAPADPTIAEDQIFFFDLMNGRSWPATAPVGIFAGHEPTGCSLNLYPPPAVV